MLITVPVKVFHFLCFPFCWQVLLGLMWTQMWRRDGQSPSSVTVRSAGCQRPCPPLPPGHGGTAPAPPGLPSPCRCPWGCSWGSGTDADPSPSISLAEGAGRPFLAASDKWSIFWDSLVGLSKLSKNPFCSHNTRAEGKGGNHSAPGHRKQIQALLSASPDYRIYHQLFHCQLWQTIFKI